MLTLEAIEYISNNIMIISGDERMMILKYNDYDFGLINTKYVFIDTYCDGLTNKDVEKAIKRLMSDASIEEIEDEIDDYRTSNFYDFLTANDDEE